MINKCLAVLALSLATVVVHAQTGLTTSPEFDQHGVMDGSGAPASALCHASTVGQIYNDNVAGTAYICKANLTWAAISGGSGGSITLPVSVANGGTGATTAANALTALGAAPASTTTTANTANTTANAALPKAGGTLTGALVLAADPTAALGAATKQYVDAHAGGSSTPIATTSVVGTVKPDGTTLSVQSDGTVAVTGALGATAVTTTGAISGGTLNVGTNGYKMNNVTVHVVTATTATVALTASPVTFPASASTILTGAAVGSPCWVYPQDQASAVDFQKFGVFYTLTAGHIVLTVMQPSTDTTITAPQTDHFTVACAL